MAFNVRKTLAHGPIRFGVTPRKPLASIDVVPVFSTGGAGEFLRRRSKAFYFADTRKESNGDLSLPLEEGAAGTPFWKAVYDSTGRGKLFLGLTIAGVLLFLIGLAVVARKGSQGWVEVVLGLILIAVPIIMTAETRRRIRVREKEELAEREAREKRHRSMLSAYAEALEQLRLEQNETTLAAAARQRDANELPYDVWQPFARRTVLRIGFAALAEAGAQATGKANGIIREASRAVGLDAADELAVKLDIYRTVVWHLLADDRLGGVQKELLDGFAEAFEIAGESPVEQHAIDQFDALRGITPEQPPTVDAPFPLKFHEVCLHVAEGSVLKVAWSRHEGRKVRNLVPDEQCKVYVTNRRLIVDGKKRREIPLVKIDEVEVDIDADVLHVRTAKMVPSLELRLHEPVYSAALIDIATAIDDKPRGFA